MLYYALFDVPNPTGELMINMSTQVYFILDEAKDVLIVPSSALNYKREGPQNQRGKPQISVKVVSDNGSITERQVQIGVRNRVQTEIKSGLEEGDKVVVTSASSGAEAAAGQRGRRPGMRLF